MATQTQTKKQENEWEDADFDAEFEDDNDDDFDQGGAGWENSNEEDDPFDVEDPNGGWGSDPALDETDASEIENKYYEAYYEKDDMEMKLASFLKVIELINAGGNDTDDFGFKSLTEIVVLYIDQQQNENAIKYFKEFLNASNNVKPNDLSNNLRKILNSAKSNNMDIYNELHDLTMQTFKGNQGSIKHLWFDLGIERCHEYMAYKMYNNCGKLVAELHESLKNDGNDDKSQTAKLLQVYAVKIQLTMNLIENLARNESSIAENEDEYNKLQYELRELIDITRGMMTNVDIISNKAMSIIYECWAKVYASSNDWSNCYKYFKESFLLYQQIAHKNTTKCLKSLLISYMILSSLPQQTAEQDKIPNPFAMDEISVYQNHQEIIIMNNLVDAFENDDINSFNKLLKQQHETDAFITKYLALVQLRLQGKALLGLVKSYDRVKLGWLGHKLGMKLDGVEKLIVKLIIDGELNGRLDQVNMFLILKEKDNKANAILNALSVWCKSVNTLRNTINSRAANKSSSFGGGMGGMRGMSSFGGFGMDYFSDDINDDLYVMDQSFLSWN